MGDELRLIGGKRAIHSHTQTANIEDLMQIRGHDLTRVWMNADTAARRGIADGDRWRCQRPAPRVACA
ncbi:MAG: molybdopterin dinucleotide binding domain-containing protein [Eggerthellaceae bacterium]